MSVRQVSQRMTHELQQQSHALIGNSQGTRDMQRFVEMIGGTDYTILLQGETGAGKDYLAETIHLNGRSGHSFVPVDCGMMSETLCEAELFGHTKGAFTDARECKPGLVQVAELGTFFFNEVANMSLGLQARFLRVLEKRSFRPLGGTREVEVNTRIITATNANLEQAVRLGNFRLDLYHRLNVIAFTVPPLRDRLEDLDELSELFLFQEGCSTKKFTDSALSVMHEYNWPGNVRELQNTVTRAVFLSSDSEEIGLEHVKPYLKGVSGKNGVENHTNDELPTFDELEKDYLTEVLKRSGGNLTKAAQISGLTRRVIQYRVKRLGLEELVRSIKKGEEDEN